MATENSLTNSAASSLASAMSTLARDTDIADFTVTCSDKEWKLHSAILAARSPFFKAAITNNMAEKLEMKVDIKEFDPETMEEVLNFMYGKPIANAPVNFLFEAAERFQMNDLKNDVEKLAKQKLVLDNVVEFAQLAEMYNAEGFLGECADFIVKNEVYMKEDFSPKLVRIVFSVLNKNLNDAKTENSRNLKFAKTEASLNLKAVKIEASQNLAAKQSSLDKESAKVCRLKQELSKLLTPTSRDMYHCTSCYTPFRNKSEAVNHMTEYH